jgi:hypothetical protein
MYHLELAPKSQEPFLAQGLVFSPEKNIYLTTTTKDLRSSLIKLYLL